MRRVPVDINTFLTNVISPVGIEPVVNYETGEHTKDKRTGLPKWKLTLLYQSPGRKKELVEIKFLANEAPKGGDATATLVLQGLEASHWENTNEYGTSSGLSLTADNVGFKPAAGQKPVRETAAA